MLEHPLRRTLRCFFFRLALSQLSVLQQPQALSYRVCPELTQSARRTCLGLSSESTSYSLFSLGRCRRTLYGTSQASLQLSARVQCVMIILDIFLAKAFAEFCSEISSTQQESCPNEHQVAQEKDPFWAGARYNYAFGDFGYNNGCSEGPWKVETTKILKETALDKVHGLEDESTKDVSDFSLTKAAEMNEDFDDILEESSWPSKKDDPEKKKGQPLIENELQGSAIATKIEMLPRVMIVGRPNVGKSALFNRLTKRREALVYNTPDGHVTRDFREGVAKIGDLRFVIYDTAGLETEADPESILVRTAGLTSAALSQCHLVLFLIDGRAGLQPFDAEVGKWLRKESPPVPVVLIMNKAEGMHADASGMLMATLGEAHSLGFGDPIALSAESGEGLSDLYQTLQPLLEQAQQKLNAIQEFSSGDKGGGSLPLQLAIAGRPNVGKSTILNSLLRQERVLTGPEPGLTRDAVRVKFEYNNRTVYLVDTAGWMQRVQVKQGPAALSAMHARRSLMRANIVVLVLDGEEVAKSRKSMLHSEVSLARWVTQEGRGLVVVVNKMDLLKGKEQAELRSKVMKAVPEEIKTILPQVEGIPIVFVSAIKGKGRSAIMKRVFESYERWNARFPTARLNNWLQKVLSRHPRKGEGGHGAKMRYITQVKARPPTFVVFITGAGDVEETDLRFLASALREDFNLGGIPIRVIPRHTKRGMNVADSVPSKVTRHPNPRFQDKRLPSLKRSSME